MEVYMALGCRPQPNWNGQLFGQVQPTGGSGYWAFLPSGYTNTQVGIHYARLHREGPWSQSMSSGNPCDCARIRDLAKGIRRLAKAEGIEPRGARPFTVSLLSEFLQWLWRTAGAAPGPQAALLYRDGLLYCALWHTGWL